MFHHVSISMVFLQQFLVEACCFLLNAGPWARHMGDAGVLSGTERKREWNGMEMPWEMPWEMPSYHMG